MLLSREPRKLNIKYILPLALFYLTVYLAADVVAYKLVILGPLLLPGPPFIFPMSYSIADIIAEVYGYSLARKTLYLTLFFQFIYAIMIMLVLKLPHPEFWTLQTAYNQVLGDLLRFVSAGFFAVLSSHFVNIYIFSKLKILLKGKNFILRTIFSSAIGGFILVAVIMLFGYSGTINSHKAISMFFSIYGLEIIYACLLAWPARMLSGFLKIKEGLDVYDTTTNFNPFKFD